MNYLLKGVFLLLILMLASACNGPEDPEESLNCPTGFEGFQCSIRSIDKFIGTWRGESLCLGPLGNCEVADQELNVTFFSNTEAIISFNESDAGCLGPLDLVCNLTDEVNLTPKETQFISDGETVVIESWQFEFSFPNIAFKATFSIDNIETTCSGFFE